MAGRNEDAESDDDDDSFEVLDLAECARGQQWWSGVFGRSSGPIAGKYSAATQVVMGGVTGWCAGYLFQRVGKVAITVFGGGFLLLQAANHSGYGKIDWKRVGKDVTEAKKHLKKRVDTAAPGIKAYIQESTAFVKRNVVLSGGFAGGFLLGLAS